MAIPNKMMKCTYMRVLGCAIEEEQSEELWVAGRYVSVCDEQIRPQSAHVSTLLDWSIEKRGRGKKGCSCLYEKRKDLMKRKVLLPGWWV